MNAFTIKDLENLSGIKAHTIRIWEQRYAFLKPQRTDTNIRYYSNDELKTILNVALLNKFGYKISHIDKMGLEDLQDKILALSPQAQQDKIINDLISLMVDLDIDSFDATFNQCIAEKGIEKAIIQVIFPFLERIGILWITNHIHPAQEHMVSNIIRQKLIVGIEKAHSLISVNRTVLVFLPEGEHHELGLLFIHYILKSRGLRVWYLGANVPLKDIDFVVKLKKPDYVYLHLTAVANNFNFEKFMARIHQICPTTPVNISGQVTANYKKKAPSNVYFRSSLQEVMDSIYEL